MVPQFSFHKGLNMFYLSTFPPSKIFSQKKSWRDRERFCMKPPISSIHKIDNSNKVPTANIVLCSTNNTNSHAGTPNTSKVRNVNLVSSPKNSTTYRSWVWTVASFSWILDWRRATMSGNMAWLSMSQTSWSTMVPMTQPLSKVTISFKHCSASSRLQKGPIPYAHCWARLIQNRASSSVSCWESCGMKAPTCKRVRDRVLLFGIVNPRECVTSKQQINIMAIILVTICLCIENNLIISTILMGSRKGRCDNWCDTDAMHIIIVVEVHVQVR